jgi:pimeloyl-ACP methyl ester carboxylesterase
MMASMWALRMYHFEQALQHVSVPTLLLFGDRSPVFQSLSTAQAKLPSARTSIQPGCGHFPMIDDPQALAGAVLAFTASLDS